MEVRWETSQSYRMELLNWGTKSWRMWGRKERKHIQEIVLRNNWKGFENCLDLLISDNRGGDVFKSSQAF